MRRASASCFVVDENAEAEAEADADAVVAG
jgi:hypothetical protein